METYTIQEAAEATGVTKTTLRRRVDRGLIRAVKQNGVRRIPRSELERAGLRLGEPAEVSDVVRELTETIRRQEQELAALRALPEKVEETRERLEEEVQARREAEARAQDAQAAAAAEAEARGAVEEKVKAEAQAAAEAREWREQLARAGWRERRRMLREARTERAA